MNQNFKNHSRYVPFWHFVTPPIILALLAGSIINFTKSSGDSRYSAALIIIIAVLFCIFYVYSRQFALRAQDRAIRAEETFRHYLLTGRPHDSNLRMRQIIALRFASDAEMPALAKKAVEQQLSPKQIKSEVQSWRPDYYRL